MRQLRVVLGHLPLLRHLLLHLILSHLQLIHRVDRSIVLLPVCLLVILGLHKVLQLPSDLVDKVLVAIPGILILNGAIRTNCELLLALFAIQLLQLLLLALGINVSALPSLDLVDELSQLVVAYLHVLLSFGPQLLLGGLDRLRAAEYLLLGIGFKVVERAVGREDGVLPAGAIAIIQLLLIVLYHDLLLSLIIGRWMVARELWSLGLLRFL